MLSWGGRRERSQVLILLARVWRADGAVTGDRSTSGGEAWVGGCERGGARG